MSDIRKNYYLDGTFGDDVEENAAIIADFLMREKPGVVWDDDLEKYSLLRDEPRAIGYNDILDAMMPREAMIAFGRHFFEAHDVDAVRQAHPPNPQTLQRNLLNPDDLHRCPRGRLVREHYMDHLNEFQSKSAQGALEQFPQIGTATHIFAHLISEYIGLINQALHECSVDEPYLKILDNALEFAEFDEHAQILSPSLALSQSLHDLNIPLQGKHLTAGIVQHLQGDRSGFESITISSSNGEISDLQVCPFQHAPGGFSTVWNTFFEAQNDGRYEARPMVGGFFNSVMGALYPDLYPQFAGAAVEQPSELEV